MSSAASAVVGALLVVAGPRAVADESTCDSSSASVPPLLSVRHDTALENMFTNYGNASTPDTWSGGDSTYSTPLPGGRELWMYSDTFLGPVNPDGSRDSTVPFIHNSFVLDDHGKLSTIHGGTAAHPDSLLSPPDPNDWYWVNASNIANGTLNVIFLEFAKTGSGVFGFAWKRNILARYSLTDLSLIDVHELPSSVPNLEWNPWLEHVGGHTYIYGVEDLGATKYMHIARVAGGDLLGKWQFFTGSGWSDSEQDSARVMRDVSNNYSITKIDGGYLLITQDTSVGFSNQIVGYFSCSPTGPFNDKTVLYTVPEAGPYGTYHDPNVIFYNPHEHPEFRQGNTLLISYDLNTLDTQQVLDDVSIYRARFIKMTFGGQ